MRLARRSVLAGGAALLAGPLQARAAPIVATPHGVVRGARAGGIERFLGIRYGADTAAGRFQAPRPPAPWRDPVDAFTYAASAPQRGDDPGSEDCLFLNVWTPAANRRARRPVLVYIHGGAYSSGSGSDPWTDGARLAAAGDVVVVTLNHRLNAFGYLYLARLDPAFADSGNAGQLDLILALRWVRDAIAGFGGDPGCVTLFGQSGGGAKIATLMGMPGAKGLFHRAVTMSGQQVTASGPLNATRRAEALLTALEATPAQAATLPAARLVEALSAIDPILGGGVYMGPVLDQRHLHRHPFWPDANPQSATIPMILGNTRDETRGFSDPNAPAQAAMTWDALPERLAREMRIDVLPEYVIAAYRRRLPAARPVDIFYAASTAARSWRGQLIEAEVRQSASAGTWVYQLDFTSPIDPARGAPHTIDIPLMFGTLDAPRSLTGTGATAQRTSDVMMRSLLAFSRTGDPNHAGLPLWPRYRFPERATMLFDTQPTVANDPRGWQRELFATIPYIQPGT